MDVDEPLSIHALESNVDTLQIVRSTETSSSDEYKRPTDHASTCIQPNTDSRKRSLNTSKDLPQAKRPSARANPDLPLVSKNESITPLPQSSRGQPWSLPSRPSVKFPTVDLTISSSPSPEPYVPASLQDLPVPFTDPFAELNDAYRNGSVWPSANREANEVSRDSQQSTTGAFVIPGMTDREVPYLPDQRLPHWLQAEDDNDEYGTFPLTRDEAEDIEDLLHNIEEHNKTTNDRTPTPPIMCSTLKEYQKIGLTWLSKMETGKIKGGILADEMGLGKTVQAISLMCANRSDNERCKTTLIIAPVALMRQWQSEIERHIHRDHAFTVYLYWGAGKKADFKELRKYDVVLTTFGTLTSEFKQKESQRESMLREREQRDPTFRRKPKDRLAILGPECMWWRVIFDEAHTIRNRSTAQSKASVDLQSNYRWCMTGTPMMNSIDDLYALLRFLKVAPYMDWQQFNNSIGKLVKSTNADTRKRAMHRVQILLKSIMLRRQKNSIVDGKEICTIPPKTTNIDNIKFSTDELAVYKALEQKSQIQFNKYVKDDSVTANYANILVLLLRLRQVCCHPHLIRDLSQPATAGIAELDLLSRARELHQDVVDRLIETRSNSFDCPICLEANPNPTIIIPCGHTVCGECVQKLIDPALSMQGGTEENSGAKCPQCRGSLKADVITDWNHFCKVHCPERLSPDLDDVQAISADSETEDEADDTDDEDSDQVDNNGNLADFVVLDNDDDESEYGHTDADDSSAEVGDEHIRKRSKKGKGKAPRKPAKTLAQLKKESMRNKAAKKRYIRRLKKTYVTSAKLEKLVELLCDIQKNDPTEKTLVFSQFTSLLDLVEIPLSHNKIRYQRYDGSMKMDERANAVNAFMDDPSQNVMLVSLKAGNAGLNLWKASRVVMLDPFWNPFIEDQAVDRAHRMPQPREVIVHRLLVPDTVEDRICALQDRKREFITAAMDEQASKSLTRLTVRDLKALFGV